MPFHALICHILQPERRHIGTSSAMTPKAVRGQGNNGFMNIINLYIKYTQKSSGLYEITQTNKLVMPIRKTYIIINRK